MIFTGELNVLAAPPCCLWVWQLPSTIHRSAHLSNRWLKIDCRHECEPECFSVFGLRRAGNLSRVYPASLTKLAKMSWDRLQLTAALNQISCSDNRWIKGLWKQWKLFCLTSKILNIHWSLFWFFRFEIGRQFTFLENKIQKSLNLQKWGPKSGKFRGIVKWEQKLDG